MDVEQQVEVEHQVPLRSVPPTTTPQVPKEKRPRQESSPPVTEVSSEEFQMHTKRPKSVSTPGATVEQEVSTTIVTTTGVKPVTLPFGSSHHKANTTAIPKKSTDSPLDT